MRISGHVVLVAKPPRLSGIRKTYQKRARFVVVAVNGFAMIALCIRMKAPSVSSVTRGISGLQGRRRMGKFDKKTPSKFVKKVATPPDPATPPVFDQVQRDQGSQVARSFYSDEAFVKKNANAEAGSCPKLLKIIKHIEENDNGESYTTAYHIWDCRSTIYVYHNTASGLSRMVSCIELGWDNRDYVERRKYLRILARTLPKMLIAVADKAEGEGY